MKKTKNYGALGTRGMLILIAMLLMSVTSIFTLIGHVSGAATWQPATVIPTQTTAAANMPAIKLDAAGNLHVAWVDTSGLNGSGTDADIYYKYRNMANGAWSNVEVVSTESTGDSGKPGMDIDPNNNVYLVWHDNTNYTGAGTNYHIFYKVRSAATGTWSPLEVISTGTANAKNPSIVAISWAAFVAWEEGSNVRFRWKNFSSGQWSAIDTISTSNSNYDHSPSITIDQSYTIHLVYIGHFIDLMDRWSVFYQSKKISDTSWSTPMHIFGVDADTLVDTNPTIRVDASGNRHITFYEAGAIPPYWSGSGMFLYHYNGPAHMWDGSDEFDTMSGQQCNSGPSLALDNSGVAQITWCEVGSVYYRCRYMNGSWSTPVVISTGMSGTAQHPTIAASASSTLHVIWDNSSRLYYATTVSPSGVPTANFVANPTTVRPGNTVQFTFTGSPGIEPSTYQWAFGDGTANSTDMNPAHMYANVGTYSVTVTVTDSNGNGAKLTKANYITVALNQAPAAGFTFSPASPSIGQAVQFTDTSTDTDGTIISWQWNFGDGTDNSTVKNPTHAFSTAGTFTVSLTVTDNEGASGVIRKTVTVTANQPPTAAFTFTPASPVVTQTVQFTDTSIDSDGTIVSWQWNFGDGTANSTVKNPTHAFSTTGTKTVTLTVTDNGGAKSVVRNSVTVVAQYMYVQNIAMSCTKTSKNYNIYTTITVYSWAGTGLSGVTVTFTLRTPSGTTYTLSGTTGSNGQVTVMKSCSKTTGTYTSTVTNLVKSGWVYDSSKNVMTSKSLVVT